MTIPAATARINTVLDGLGAAGLEEVLPILEEVELTSGTVLQEPGEPVSRVLFPLHGVVSLVVLLEGGAVEAATVGCEGMLGLTLFLGSDAPTEQAIVVVDGSALSLSAADFTREISILDGPLERALRRHAAAMFTQVARNAACNRTHSVTQRTARWLLQAADRTANTPFALTQDTLARVLAVRRASVNEVARALAAEGCISYTRGIVTVVDRDRLLPCACSCYAALASGRLDG